MYYGGVTDDAVVADHLKKLDEKLKIYDQILGKQKYVAGDVRDLFCPSSE